MPKVEAESSLNFSVKKGPPINPEKIALARLGLESGIFGSLRERERSVLLGHLLSERPNSLTDFTAKPDGKIVTKQRIYQIEKRALEKIERLLAGESIRKRKWKDSPELRADLLNSNITNRAIAKKYKINYSTVTDYRRNLGIRPKIGRPKKSS